MISAIELGPFSLEQPIGSGGIGIVWRGRHRPTGKLVAVKVVESGVGVSDKIAWSFRTEAQSASSLDHPNIVPVYEFGQIPVEAAEASEGLLEAGTPYLVTAFVGGGTLRPTLGRLGSEQIFWLAGDLLDALAHAHARGVVHRDINPANVLVTDDRLAVQITDFGIAYAVATDRETGGERLVAGTPSYMAPEQIFESWRDHGSWTDIYSLGCLIWALVCGAPPYTNRAIEMVSAGLHDLEARPFEPLCALPRGFEEWVRGFIAIDPACRFRHAAEARVALGRLLEDCPQGSSSERSPLPAAPPKQTKVETKPTPEAEACRGEVSTKREEAMTLRSLAGVTADTEVSWLARSLQRGERECDPSPSGAVNRVVFPIPKQWRRTARTGQDAVLPSTGIGLFGLRRIPLLGREDTCDRLWGELREASLGRPRAVLLRGPAGFGKTRLLKWLAETAYEIGAVEILWAHHGQVPGREHGLGAMLARYLRCEGLGLEEIRPRLRKLSRLLPLPDDDAFAELLCPTKSLEEVMVLGEAALEGDGARTQMVQEFLVELSRERTLLLILDDAQWATEALSLTVSLLSQEGCRIFIVLAARDEALAEEPEAALMLEALTEIPGSGPAETVGPIAQTDHVELVRRLVGLDDVACSLIAERTAGSPLFAEHLVGDWIARGVLRPGDGGYHLDPGSCMSLPEDLRAMWSARIDRALVKRSEQDGVALELAAVLGRDVDADEWKAACAHAGLRVPVELVVELASQGLVRAGPRGLRHGFGFVQEMLRESLVLRARAAGRFEEHHCVCAHVFMGAGGPTTAERLGMHLFHGGLPQPALNPLLLALEHAAFVGDGPRARTLLAVAEQAAGHIAVGRPYLDLARLKLVASEIAPLTGDAERAFDLANECIEMARQVDPSGKDRRWQRIAALGERQLGRLGKTHSECLRHFEAAAEIAKGLDDPELEAKILLSLASFSRRLAEPSARASALASLEAFERLGDPFGIASSRMVLGWIEHTAGNGDAAAKQATQALAVLPERSATVTRAECHLLLGDVARSTDDLSAAQDAYARASRLYRAVGDSSTVVASLNLVLVRLEMGAYSAARTELETCRLALERGGFTDLRSAVHLSLLPCLADAGDLEAFDENLREAERLLEEPGVNQVDHADLARLAGDLASKRGWTDRAGTAYRLSALVWRSLGRDREAAEMERRRELLE